MLSMYKPGYSIIGVISRLFGLDEELVESARYISPGNISSDYVGIYSGVAISSRIYGDPVHIEASILGYFAEKLEGLMLNAFNEHEDLISYIDSFMAGLKIYVDEEYIDIPFFKEAANHVLERFRSLGSENIVDSVFNALSPGFRWIRRNIVRAKCSSCGREYVTITRDAQLFLLAHKRIYISEDFLNRCPKCRRGRHRYLCSYMRDVREKLVSKHKCSPGKTYREYMSKIEELRRIYHGEIEELDKKLKEELGSDLYDIDYWLIRTTVCMTEKDFYREVKVSKRLHRIKTTINILLSSGPMDIDELSSRVAESLGEPFKRIKRWINNQALSLWPYDCVTYIDDKHQYVDISPSILLIMFFNHLNNVGAWLDVPDIYYFFKTRNLNYMIRLFNLYIEYVVETGDHPRYDFMDLRDIMRKFSNKPFWKITLFDEKISIAAKIVLRDMLKGLDRIIHWALFSRRDHHGFTPDYFLEKLLDIYAISPQDTRSFIAGELLLLRKRLEDRLPHLSKALEFMDKIIGMSGEK